MSVIFTHNRWIVILITLPLKLEKGNNELLVARVY